MIKHFVYKEEIESATILYRSLPDLRHLYVKVTPFPCL